jgi:hypothetical protein
MRAIPDPTSLRGGALLLLLACGRAPQTVEVVAIDYMYEMPGRVAAGPTRFELTNRDDVPHQVLIYRFRSGIGPDSARQVLARHNVPDSLLETGRAMLIARPGESVPSAETTDLRPGQVWGLECMLQDSDTAPRHNTMGMYAVLEVR